jgi:N-methylhydantoinase A
VPRYLRRRSGRLAHDGRERAPLDLSGLPSIVEDFRADGVEAVAICLLHAYADPSHEEAVLAGVRELWPEVSVVASHQITREWREYERTSTAVLSAYVQPLAGAVPHAPRRRRRASGFDGQLYICSRTAASTPWRRRGDPDHDGRVGPCERLGAPRSSAG